MNIYQATTNDLDQVAVLFDKYRQFYEEAPNYDGCRNYLQQRMQNNESIIFVAQNEAGAIVGFTQLYPTFCSVALRPIFQLYDLFVDPTARKQGVGRALMTRAKDYAKANGASRLQLETGVDNAKAQALYEALGWERETHYYTYTLEF